ncbi:cation diffusion facilitator family transporter [Rubinisphaera margarita]|uniref:cation diffusion facilitator family transporter n=1 Tax=Rubinisphaera margarita TaxID=2909586 RepID=UPI001EE89E68|nr:cation diffusion facilitator family transporter [Rubinisphaera margarita]MCG6158476.1 cation diffusion facilitator family transporter [Rubinisphaera margarita]
MYDTAARYREATTAALIGLSVNLVLGIIKLIAGLVARSTALIADAVNSLGDALSSLAVVYGLRISQLPADDEHPYGHARAEGIAATTVAVVIIVSAAIVGWEALTRLGQLAPAVPWWAIAIAATNVVLKEGLFQFKVRVGRRTRSASIIANAWDHRSDALCSLAVLVGFVVVRVGGPSLGWADQVAAIIVSLGVIWSGIRLFRSSANELMDTQAESELLDQIRERAMSITGVEGVETLLVRKVGLEFFVDVHIEVNPSITVDYGHRIGHHVKDRLLTDFQELRDVLVHLEPHRAPDPGEHA